MDDESLIDGFAQHTVNILRVEAGARAKALQALLDLEGSLLGKVATATNPNQQAKLKALLEQTQGSISKAYGVIEKNHLRDMRGLAGLEAKATTKVMNKAIGVDILSVAATPKLLESVVDEKIVMGHSAGDWWKKQGSDLQHRFGGEMAQGILSGETNEELMKRVRGTKANDYNDGIMSASRREAAALVRSSAIAVSNAARLKSLEEMGDIVKGVQWVSTLDGRTTKICIALSGLAWRLPDYEPIGHDKKFPGPTAHWNCRSTTVPVLRSWEELSGQKIPALNSQDIETRMKEKLAGMGMSPEQMAAATRNTRASMDGQVPADIKFDDWLKRKPDGFVDDLLGPGRAKLWDRGKGPISLSELTDQTNRPLTLKQLDDYLTNGDPLPETSGVSYFALDPVGKYIEAATAAEALPDAAAAAKQAADDQAKLDIETILAEGTKLEKQAAEAALAAGGPMDADTLAKIKATAAAKQAAQTQSATIAKAKANFLAGKEFTPGQLKALDGLDPAAKADYLDTWAQLKTAADAKAAAAALTAEALAKQDELAEALGNYKVTPEQIKLISALPDDIKKQLSVKATAIQELAQAVLKAENTLTYIANSDALALEEWATGTMDAPDKAFIQEALDALPTGHPAKVKFEAAAVKMKETVAKVAPAKAFISGLSDEDLALWTEKPNSATATKIAGALSDLPPGSPEKTDFYLKLQTLADKKSGVKFLGSLTNEQLKEIADNPLADSPLVKNFWFSHNTLGDTHPVVVDAFAKVKAIEQAALGNVPIPAPAGKKPRARKPKAGTVAPPVAAPPMADVPALDPIIPPDFPKNPAGLQVVRRLGGSTGAELVKDESGKLYVRKGGASADHVRSEFGADRLYAAFGLDVPRGALYNATGPNPIKLTEYIEGKEFSSLSGAAKAKAIEELKKGFAVDALMGNWDVVGASGDNVLWDGTRALRIDNGGALSYRAQGGLKNADEWSEFPTEIHTMRESAQGKNVFGNLTIYDIARQASAINEAAIDAAGLDANTTAMVKARLVQLKAVSERAGRFERDQFKDTAFDLHARQMLTIRKAGIDQNLLGATTRTGGVTVRDAKTGKAFGNLRTDASAVSSPAADDPWGADIEKAFITVNSHHAKGDQANTTTLVKAMKHESYLHVVAKKPGPQQAMAIEYLKVMPELNKQYKLASNGLPPDKLLPMFNKVAPTGPMPVAQTSKSVISALHDEIEKQLVARGVDVNTARKAKALWGEWIGSQATDSWNAKPMAAKYWFWKQRTTGESAAFWGGSHGTKTIAQAKAEYDTMAGFVGGEENLDYVFHAHHALMQEQLALADIDYNDRDKKVLLLMRTEQKGVLKSEGKKDANKNPIFGRGTTESHSVFEPYYYKGNTLTVQAVPHSRVLWSYWFERNPGTGYSSFAGDHENEFAADSSFIPYKDFGKLYSHPVPASAKLEDWAKSGIPIDHL